MNEINRIYRTEVIWKPERVTQDFDPEDSCPINLDFVFECIQWRHGDRRRKILFMVSAAAFVMMLAAVMITYDSFSVSSVGSEFERKRSITWNGGLHNEFSDIEQSFSMGNEDVSAIHPGETIPLPIIIHDNIADVDEPRRDEDVTYFFHIPRTAGASVKDILGSCAGLTTASDVGARDGHRFDANLTIVLDDLGSKYVNVDTSTVDGIARAKKLGLVESGLADVVVTQYLYAGATLFNPVRRGRMFTLLRHPVERAVSMFHYLSFATWEPTYDPDLAYISIEMYARSLRIEHNWMVRLLSNELENDLTLHHLELAKEVLRKKCIIGLLEDKSESWDRFERFFRWKFPTRRQRECQERILHWGWSNKHSHPTLEEGSLAWNLLLKRNELDMKLYEYALQLYQEQTALFGKGGSLVP
ncbi:hypothetical protein ACHAW6_014421 [Cyclotella cf. meneghiniana]